MATYQYDPAEVRVYVVALPTVTELSDFAPGTFVTLSRDEARWRKHVGLDDQVARTRGMRAGRISMSLEAGSRFNAVLSALHISDDLLRTGIAAIYIRDRSGLDLGFAVRAWLIGPPDLSKGAEAGQVDWLWDADIVEIFHGGLKPIDGGGLLVNGGDLSFG